MAREPMLVLDVLRHLICRAVSFALGEVLAVVFANHRESFDWFRVD